MVTTGTSYTLGAIHTDSVNSIETYPVCEWSRAGHAHSNTPNQLTVSQVSCLTLMYVSKPIFTKCMSGLGNDLFMIILTNQCVCINSELIQKAFA